MINLTLAELTKILELPSSASSVSIQGLCIDSRKVIPGNLFIAIQGENFDGHDFIEEAINNGAHAIVTSRTCNSSVPQFIVSDTVNALGKIAAHWRNQFSLPLIGVTGSNGKTTLKNMIAAIMLAACQQDQKKVLATQGNFNNHIGLPITLSRLNAEHRYAVLEMGMNHFGEIAYLTELAKPFVAIINNAAESHLAGVETVAGVAQAKGEIFLGLNKNGIAILNRDDAFYFYWEDLVGDHKFFTFGMNHTADINVKIQDHQKIIITTPKGNISLTLPLLGNHNIMNALAATAATLAIGIDLSAIKAGLENTKPAIGRMQQYPLANQILVIDDTYNANPFSLDAAVNTLVTIPGKKILVLGDMKELGPEAKQFHAKAGEKAKQAGVDFLYTLGELSQITTLHFGEHAEHFFEREKLIASLQKQITEKTTILVKGSRSMKMEQIVASIVPQPLETMH